MGSGGVGTYLRRLTGEGPTKAGRLMGEGRINEKIAFWSVWELLWTDTPRPPRSSPLVYLSVCLSPGFPRFCFVRLSIFYFLGSRKLQPPAASQLDRSAKTTDLKYSQNGESQSFPLIQPGSEPMEEREAEVNANSPRSRLQLSISPGQRGR